MKEDSGNLEFGEVLDESFDFKRITWTVPNVSSIPTCVDYKIQTASFSFAEATWKLLMYPNGQTKYKSQEFIDLMVGRLNSRIPKHHILYKFYFKTKCGKEFDSYSNYVSFNTNFSVGGVTKYQRKSKFIEMNDVIAPDDVLTVVCEMSVKKIPVIDESFQLESVTSHAESSSETTEQKPESSTFTCKDINILSDYKELFLKQEDCDVIIKVKGQEFSAHRTILRARCSVFASTFRNDMKEKATGVIDIEDCDPSSFSDFLCFLYCGYLENLSTENVFSLFTTADKYDVQDLRSECLEFMKKNLSVDTFCNTITLALQHSEKELIKLTTDFFAKNLLEIIVTVKWQSFLIENPIQSNELLIKALSSNKK